MPVRQKKKRDASKIVIKIKEKTHQKGIHDIRKPMGNRFRLNNNYSVLTTENYYDSWRSKAEYN